MERVTGIVVLLAGLLLASCGSSPEMPARAPSVASSPEDQVVRGVGNLRRLLVLPVVIEQGSCDWPEVARDLDESVVRFLRDWKGYELVRPAQLDDAWKLARRLGEWQEGDVGKGRPPSELRARLVAAGTDARADGVVAVHASPECPGGADAGLLTLPRRLAESLNRTLSAGVYETATGTLHWHRHIRPPGWDPVRYGSRPPPRFETRQAAEGLLGPIENAVPAVLKAPPRPRAAAKPAVEAAQPAPVAPPPAAQAAPAEPPTTAPAAPPPVPMAEPLPPTTPPGQDAPADAQPSGPPPGPAAPSGTEPPPPAAVPPSQPVVPPLQLPPPEPAPPSPSALPPVRT
jgi:hypothetical protein